MSNDFDAQVVLNVAAFNASVEQLKKAMHSLQSSVAYVDLPDDIPEDESYSTAASRNSRWLSEMFLASFMASISFSIDFDIIRGPKMTCTLPSIKPGGEERHVSTDLRFPATTAGFVEEIATALSDVIEQSINERSGVSSANYEIEVSYDNGHFIDVHTGELLANSVNEMITYCHIRKCEIAIVPDYD